MLKNKEELELKQLLTDKTLLLAFRGEAWNNTINVTCFRIAYRGWSLPGTFYRDISFRIIKEK